MGGKALVEGELPLDGGPPYWPALGGCAYGKYQPCVPVPIPVPDIVDVCLFSDNLPCDTGYIQGKLCRDTLCLAKSSSVHTEL